MVINHEEGHLTGTNIGSKIKCVILSELGKRGQREKEENGLFPTTKRHVYSISLNFTAAEADRDQPCRVR